MKKKKPPQKSNAIHPLAAASPGGSGVARGGKPQRVLLRRPDSSSTRSRSRREEQPGKGKRRESRRLRRWRRRRCHPMAMAEGKFNELQPKTQTGTLPAVGRLGGGDGDVCAHTKLPNICNVVCARRVFGCSRRAAQWGETRVSRS